MLQIWINVSFRKTRTNFYIQFFPKKMQQVYPFDGKYLVLRTRYTERLNDDIFEKFNKESQDELINLVAIYDKDSFRFSDNAKKDEISLVRDFIRFSLERENINGILIFENKDPKINKFELSTIISDIHDITGYNYSANFDMSNLYAVYTSTNISFVEFDTESG